MVAGNRKYVFNSIHQVSLSSPGLFLSLSFSPHPSFPVLTPTQPIFTESLGHMRKNKITKLCSAHPTVWMKAQSSSDLKACSPGVFSSQEQTYPLPYLSLDSFSFPSPLSFFLEVLSIWNRLGEVIFSYLVREKTLSPSSSVGKILEQFVLEYPYSVFGMLFPLCLLCNMHVAMASWGQSNLFSPSLGTFLTF